MYPSKPSWRFPRGSWAGMLFVLALLFLGTSGQALAACGDPGESACHCGIGGLGRCCDYDYLVLLKECSDASGFPTFCGGTDEPACTLAQHARACKSGRTNVGGTCRLIDADGYPSSCGGESEFPCTLNLQIALGIRSCKSGLAELPFPGGTCKRLDGDGFPTFCGGAGERPCNLNEHIPSCKSGLAEVPFPGGNCTALDADGFPPFCGGQGERACVINEHIPSCKGGLFEVDGRCSGVDSDGYPTLCGDVGERACTINIQLLLGIRSCKESTVPGVEVAEIPFGFGTCTELDADGFPPLCGDENERSCTLLEHIPSCKRDFEESILEGICRDTFPAGCGRNGQRPCNILENLAGCKRGLTVRGGDFGECGEDPATWPAAEVPRGGRRTVFLIHGRGGDIADFADPDASGINRLAHRLQFETPNVTQVYGVDWNAAAGSDERQLTIRKLYWDTSGTCTGLNDENETICEGGPRESKKCDGDEACHGPGIRNYDYGTIAFNYENFEVYEIARALFEAIEDLPTEKNLTIITTSYGGVIGRQLVYRHYDELRRTGKRIAEMVTVAAPHLGGGMATPIVPDGELIQNDLACTADLFHVDRAKWHNVCELGRWHDFRQRREAGSQGPPDDPVYIDDRGYPQIRWINVVENGYRLTVLDDLVSGLDPDSLPPPLDTLAEDFLLLVSGLDAYDSDGIILTTSAWGIQADECYPFTRVPGPEGLPIEVTYLVRDNDGSNVLSAECHHPAARVDPRYQEREDLRLAHDLNNEDIRDFVQSVLWLEGETNGDGVVSAADQTAVAEAGPDRIVECTGPLTDVTLDATGSADPASGGLTYDWSGSFGSATGTSPTIALPLGVETITLSVEDIAGRTDSDEVRLEVVDTTPPFLDAGEAIRLEATSAEGAEVAVAPSAATDLCGAVSLSVSPTLSVFPLGTTVLTFTATDEQGNTSTVTRTIEIIDTTPPVLSAPADLVAEAAGVLSPLDPGTATATDLSPVVVENDAPEDGFPLGTTIVTWAARDTSGNEASATQEITMTDATPPVIALPADVTAEATALRTPLAIGTATATDIFAVDVGNHAPADGYPLGLTLVIWTAVDAHGNEAAGVQRVTVVDTTLPALEMPPDISLTAAGPLTPVAIGAASATDLFGPVSLTNDMPAAGFPPGTTLVTWTAEDANGNRVSGTQRVEATYRFGGMAPPLEDGGIYKASRTLPVKFSLFYAGGDPVATASARIQVIPLGSDNTPGEPLDVQSSSTADGGDAFRYQGGLYHFNLSTGGMPAGRYRVVLVLDDGTRPSVDLILR